MTQQTLWRAIYVLLAAGMLFVSTPAFPAVYVSPSGDNTTGASWATAYTSVQAGLDSAATSGEDVWVAAATYVISTPLTFGNDITVYGGFPPTGNPGMAGRNPAAYETFLDGNGGANNVINIEESSGAYINGFTFINGNNSTTGYDGGGAIRIADLADGICTIEQCRFVNSTSNRMGGAIVAIHSTLHVANCVFDGNHAGEGGSVMGYYGVMRFTDCSFDNSSCTAAGGAVGCYDGSLSMTRCTVRNCVAGGHGAGVEAHESGPMVLDHCIIENNHTDWEGAGISAMSCESVSVINCVIAGNTANGMGGGVMSYGNNATFDGCLIYDNAGTLGAGIEFHESYVTTIQNCAFFNNAASGDGGAVFDGDGTQVTVANCTFVANSAEGNGAGVYVRNAPTNVFNCIFSGQQGVAIYESQAGFDAAIHNCCFHNSPDGLFYDLDTDTTFYSVSGSEGLHENLAETSGNIEADPLFLDVTNKDFHLAYDSPCLDAGTPTGAPDHDYDGDARPSVAGFDIGADEALDTDGDLLLDALELVLGTNPDSADSDGDHLNDRYEVNYDRSADYDPYDPVSNPDGTDTNATEPDSDGDGVNDGSEVSFGFDPLDAANTPALPLSAAALAVELLVFAAFALRKFKQASHPAS